MNKSDYIYLDHAATTPMREVAFEAYKKTEMDAYANSSGGHALSRKAKNILEESREFIASCAKHKIDLYPNNLPCEVHTNHCS